MRREVSWPERREPRTRRPLRSLLWLALLLAPACTSGVEPRQAPQPGPSLLGADLSALERIEQAGVVFRDSGVAGDAMAILRRHGSDLVRLRLFVQPSGQGVEVNDLAYTIRLARRAKAVGATLLLALHYSDTWADPGHQTTPAAWASGDLVALEAQVDSYTTDVMTQLRQAGALPDIVQIGNEVDGGMLWPTGALRYDHDSLASWDAFTRLMNAGIRGVRGALVAGDSVRILVHYSQGGNVGGTRWFLDHLVARGVAFDLVGLSYYPWWHGTREALAANLTAVAERYQRDVVVVETAYPWRNGGWEPMATNRAAMTWPVSRAGQAAFLRDVRAAVGRVPANRGLGVVWWYPESVEVPGVTGWAAGSLALFDDEGNLLPALAGVAASHR